MIVVMAVTDNMGERMNKIMGSSVSFYHIVSDMSLLYTCMLCNKSDDLIFHTCVSYSWTFLACSLSHDCFLLTGLPCLLCHVMHQVKLVNISNNDIVDGNPKLTLGLVWSIILHWQVCIFTVKLIELSAINCGTYQHD